MTGRHKNTKLRLEIQEERGFVSKKSFFFSIFQRILKKP